MNKEHVKQHAEVIAENIIRACQNNPCRTCGYRSGEQCLAGFKQHGRCPVFKILKEKFSEL